MSFTFKRFHIEDGHTAMKVGTDAVVLGAWALAGRGGAFSVVDAGSGCGILSLMLAQRFPGARITAVEIDAGAHGDCARNAEASPFNARIEPVCADFMGFAPKGKVDAVVSNPPYFVETQHSPDASRALARHGDGLTPYAVLDFAAKHLAGDGTVSLIVPAKTADDLIFHAEMLRLREHRCTYVATRPGMDPVRVLLEFGRREACPVRSLLVLRNPDGGYSTPFRELVHDFYLNL